ncbi:MAG TPA: alpha/beta fold hydrolase [Ktedonobacterales bacterium]|nr:alpha/beta fold hydrolase [Ktedonobacterales bacterium]
MKSFVNNAPGPHASQPVLAAGESPEAAKSAMLMLHGRGATAENILELAGELNRPGFFYLAPQAAGYEWYPNRFTAPMESNEPYLSSALATIDTLLAQLASAGIGPERTIVLGFSQGACLALEYVARHARRYGGMAGLSGGLIGPPGTPRDYAGSMAGTPVFLGCSDVDMHIPRERVHETTEVFRRLGGDVTERLYRGMGHTINQDEITFVQGMMAALTA